MPKNGLSFLCNISIWQSDKRSDYFIDYVGNYISIDKSLTRALNLVVSGCGTGKTYFFANELLGQLDVAPYEVLFVTSRALAVEQQAAQYDSLIRLQPDDDVIQYWHNGEQAGVLPTDTEHIRITTYDKLETLLYGNENHSLNRMALTNVKVVIFDEIHSVFCDTFIPFMRVLQMWLSEEIHLGNRYFFGLTATPGILYECAFDCNFLINCINEPLFNYKAKHLLCVDTDELIRLVNEELSGKTIIMCRYARTCYWLQKQIKGSYVLSSKNGDDYIECNMADVRRSIVHNFKLPDNVKVLIATETIREGFTFIEESNIQNVVTFSPDEMNVHQFAGRCRYNFENLIAVNARSKTERVGYMGEQIKMFEDFCKNPGKHPAWFDGISDIVSCPVDDVVITVNNVGRGYHKASKPQERNPSITKFLRRDSQKKLYDYFCENWLSGDGTEPKLIYGNEIKEEIVNEVMSLGVFTSDAKIDTWLKLENVLNDIGFEIENSRSRINGKRVRCKTLTKKAG